MRSSRHQRADQQLGDDQRLAARITAATTADIINTSPHDLWQCLRYSQAPLTLNNAGSIGGSLLGVNAAAT